MADLDSHSCLCQILSSCSALKAPEACSPRTRRRQGWEVAKSKPGHVVWVYLLGVASVFTAPAGSLSAEILCL